MIELTTAMFQRHWPHGDQHVPGLVEGIVRAAPVVFEEYGIKTPIVVAIILGEFSEECGAGLEMTENMNYSAQGLLQTFPRHFTGTMAQRYAHNPRMIADVAYGGRMGNAPPPSDDGWQYRGRGLSQVTGKEGYEALQRELTRKGIAIDILANPDLVSSPDYALVCGVADFVLCGCLPFAEKGDVLNTTKRLNGGTNGLAERERWTAIWKKELLPTAANVVATLPAAQLAGQNPHFPV